MREAKAKERPCLNIRVLLSLCTAGWRPSSPILSNRDTQDQNWDIFIQFAEFKTKSASSTRKRIEPFTLHSSVFFSFLCLKIKLQTNLIFSAVQIPGESGFKNLQLIHTIVNVSTGCKLLPTQRIQCYFCCIGSTNYRNVFCGKTGIYTQHHFLRQLVNHKHIIHGVQVSYLKRLRFPIFFCKTDFKRYLSVQVLNCETLFLSTMHCIISGPWTTSWYLQAHIMVLLRMKVNHSKILNYFTDYVWDLIDCTLG